jgi:hypothetical protein
MTQVGEEKTPAKQWIILTVFLVLFFGSLFVLARIGTKTLISAGTLWAIAGVIGAVVSLAIMAFGRSNGKGSKQSVGGLLMIWVLSSLVFGGIGVSAFLLVNYLGANNEQKLSYPIEELRRHSKRGAVTYYASFKHNGKLQELQLEGNAYTAQKVEITLAQGLLGYEVALRAKGDLGIEINLP